MSDETSNPRTLSQISHLFLSSVRQRQTGGATPPVRKPPAPSLSIDLTPEEFREVFAAGPREDVPHAPPVRALLAAHLGEKQLNAARAYARAMASSGKRIGLIVLDVCEFRLLTFEDGADLTPPDSADESHSFDPRIMRDAITELNCDLDGWLLLVCNPRLPEARAVLRAVDRCVLLSACDHDGVVASYRTLKGIVDVARPRLSLAALPPAAPAEAEQMYRKLSTVCAQFISWTIEPEPAIAHCPNVAECQVICCRTQHDKSQLAAAAHWQVVQELIEQSRQCAAAAGSVEETVHPSPAISLTPAIDPDAPADESPFKIQPSEEPPPRSRTVFHEPTAAPAPPEAAPEPAPRANPFTPPPLRAPAPSLKMPVLSEIIELADDQGDQGDHRDERHQGHSADEGNGVLEAVMKHATGELVECPVRPPMCPEARLAISRDRRLILIAVAGHGLSQIKTIGHAYRWAVENRPLLAMALPQLSLDPHQLPHLRLLVDQSDVNASALQPLFQVNTVAIQTYRRVRWGQRTGLLLDAA